MIKLIIKLLIQVLIYRNKSYYILPDGKDKIDMYLLNKVFGYIHKEKEVVLSHIKGKAISKLLAEQFNNQITVTRGPFRGLKYPQAVSYGSVLVPKLIGSYEAELQPFIKEMIEYQYDDVIDIGCAEGYYAIGLARVLPKATVYAYDLNVDAIKYCEEMARLNGVADRVLLDGLCSIDKILKIRNSQRKQVIICDIEGGEFDLFNATDPNQLCSFTMLIELHAKFNQFGLDSSSVENLKLRFTQTHNIYAIPVKRKDPKNYSELQSLNQIEQELVNADIRSRSLAGWIYLTPKSENVFNYIS